MATDFKALWRAKADGKEIEVRSVRPGSEWQPIEAMNYPVFREFFIGFQNSDWEFRIKPETVMVNGHELPAPLTKEHKGAYWVVLLYGEPAECDTAIADPDETTRLWFEKGLCHATKEDAEAWECALLDWRTCNGTK